MPLSILSTRKKDLIEAKNFKDHEISDDGERLLSGHKDEANLEENCISISKQESPKKETKGSSIFLFGTGFGNWGLSSSSAEDVTDDVMDMDDVTDDADPLLSSNCEEESQTSISESFTVPELSRSQMDGECDLVEDCEEVEPDTRTSSDSDSPPWFLADAASKQEDDKSPIKIKSCDVSLRKVEVTEEQNKLKSSPQKEESESEPDYVELDSDEEEGEVKKTRGQIELVPATQVSDADSEDSEDDHEEEKLESEVKSQADIELVEVTHDSDDDVVEGSEDEDEDVVRVRGIPGSQRCRDCGLRGDLIHLFHPGDGSSQAGVNILERTSSWPLIGPLCQMTRLLTNHRPRYIIFTPGARRSWCGTPG